MATDDNGSDDLPPEEDADGQVAEVISLEDFRKAAQARRAAAEQEGEAGEEVSEEVQGFVTALADALEPFADDDGHVQLDLTRPEDRGKAVEVLKGVGAAIRDSLLGRLAAVAAEQAEAEAEAGEEEAETPVPEEVAARAGGGPAEVSEVPTREEAAEEDEAGGGLAPLLGSLLSGLTRPAATGGITVNVNINFPGAAPGGGRSAGERRRDEEAEPEDPEGD